MQKSISILKTKAQKENVPRILNLTRKQVKTNKLFADHQPITDWQVDVWQNIMFCPLNVESAAGTVGMHLCQLRRLPFRKLPKRTSGIPVTVDGLGCLLNFKLL